MSFPIGSFSRTTVAALLAPLAPAVCALPVLEAWQDVTGRSWGIHSSRDFLLGWLSLSLLVSVVGLMLRAWNRVALRHHLLTMLGIGLIPLLLTLAAWPGAERAISCRELMRPEGVDLPARMTLALLIPTAGAAFKWMVYGFERLHTATDGWKLAGALYVLALIVDIGGQVGQVSGTFPAWSEIVSRNCE